MTPGTTILTTTGAPDERKSHEAISANMSNMDPNEVAKAVKKLTSAPFVDVSSRFNSRIRERHLTVVTRVEGHDADDLRAMSPAADDRAVEI